MTDLDNLEWEPHDRHWIRLRGPWEMRWVHPQKDGEAPVSTAWSHVKLPAAWQELCGPLAGEAQFRRRFQQPTHLDPDERILITLCDVQCSVQAELNDTPLPQLDVPIGDSDCSACEDALSYEITHLIRPSNRLVLNLRVEAAAIAAGDCGLWRPVLLEIILPA